MCLIVIVIVTEININIVNDGSILGQGEAEFSPEEGRLTPNGLSGLRLFNGLDTPKATLTGLITNNNLIFYVYN
mgnify:CR=1 FL=1